MRTLAEVNREIEQLLGGSDRLTLEQEMRRNDLYAERRRLEVTAAAKKEQAVTKMREAAELIGLATMNIAAVYALLSPAQLEEFNRAVCNVLPVGAGAYPRKVPDVLRKLANAIEEGRL